MNPQQHNTLPCKAGNKTYKKFQRQSQEKDILDHHFGLCARRTACSLRVGMGIELDFLRVRKFENFFETLSTTHVSTSARKEGEGGGELPNSFQDFLVGARFCPQADSVETFPCIDNDAHDFIVSLLFKCFANRRKHLN